MLIAQKEDMVIQGVCDLVENQMQETKRHTVGINSQGVIFTGDYKFSIFVLHLYI